MHDAPISAWEAMREYYTEHKDNELSGVRFNLNSKSSYIDDFISQYNEIKRSYMNPNAKELDRHKQAAILLYCTIKNNVFLQDGKTPDKKIFVACEKIGLMVSLSFMKEELNSVLEEIKEEKIDKYILPEAFSCNTDYFDILVRDLYLQKHKDDGVYILLLAHILYLIEYNTLDKINPQIIKKLQLYNMPK